MRAKFPLEKTARPAYNISGQTFIGFPPVRHVGQAAAPLFCMLVLDPFPASGGKREYAGRRAPGGEKSSPRPLSRPGGDSGRDGAATLRVPARTDRRGPQGKATVESIVAGVSGCPPAHF